MSTAKKRTLATTVSSSDKITKSDGKTKPDGKKMKNPMSGETFHWTDERDETFTSLVISNHVNSQKTSAQQNQMWLKTVKECFDQDSFVNDKVKWYDSSEDDVKLRDALLRRFKSRLSVLKKNCDAFMAGIFTS